MCQWLFEYAFAGSDTVNLLNLLVGKLVLAGVTMSAFLSDGSNAVHLLTLQITTYFRTGHYNKKPRNSGVFYCEE